MGWQDDGGQNHGAAIVLPMALSLGRKAAAISLGVIWKFSGFIFWPAALTHEIFVPLFQHVAPKGTRAFLAGPGHSDPCHANLISI